MKATISNTKDIIESVLAAGTDARMGQSIHMDGIQIDLDGSALAEWLTDCGFEVAGNEDTGRCGLVNLTNGVNVSNNGYAYVA